MDCNIIGFETVADRLALAKALDELGICWASGDEASELMRKSSYQCHSSYNLFHGSLFCGYVDGQPDRHFSEFTEPLEVRALKAMEALRG